MVSQPPSTEVGLVFESLDAGSRVPPHGSARRIVRKSRWEVITRASQAGAEQPGEYHVGEPVVAQEHPAQAHGERPSNGSDHGGGSRPSCPEPADQQVGNHASNDGAVQRVTGVGQRVRSRPPMCSAAGVSSASFTACTLAAGSTFFEVSGASRGWCRASAEAEGCEKFSELRRRRSEGRACAI
jgi:hypothetical protein